MFDLLAVTPNPVLSVLLLALLAELVLYLARMPAHRFLLGTSRALYATLRVAARAATTIGHKLAARNRDVLLAQGRAAAERLIEREFSRIQAAVANDLSQAPTLQRELREKIAAIEEDYQRSVELPPDPPQWAKAVEAVAHIPGRGDPLVARALEDIHASLVRANELAINEYRRSSRDRHRLLVNMMPAWRQAQRLLERLDHSIGDIQTRAKTIDRQMETYRELSLDPNRSLASLTASSLTRFLFASLMLGVGLGAMFVNFHLIVQPMQQLAGDGSVLLGIGAGSIAALVTVGLQAALGIYLMEALRITRLLPVVDTLDAVARKRSAWAAFALLLALACAGAALAYVRHVAPATAGLGSPLLDNQPTVGAGGAILAAYAMLAFVLPLVSAFLAVPLEAALHASRIVAGWLGVGLLRMIALALRLLATLTWRLGSLSRQAYDLAIFAPLWIEMTVKNRRHPPHPASPLPALPAEESGAG